MADHIVEGREQELGGPEDYQHEVRLGADGRLEGSPPAGAIDYGTRRRKLAPGDALKCLEDDCRAAFCGESFFVRADATPRCSLEAAALAVFDFHTKNSPVNRSNSYAEFWSQVREPLVPAGGGGEGVDEGLAFHYDKDEDLCDECGVTVHPHISTVTYLTSDGAPTIVLEREGRAGPRRISPSGHELILSAVVSHPRAWTHLSFG